MKPSNLESPDARQKPMDGSHVGTADARWKGLYRVGGVAALMAAAFYVIEIIGVIAMGPPPTTVIGWFTLLQHNRLRGLFDLFFLDMVVTALLVPLFLALYAALRRASPYLMALATILGFVGIAVYFASNTAFSMLSLSSHYAAATTDAQRAQFEAAGQAALTGLAVTQGAGLQVANALNAIAGVLISAVMLRSTIFSKVTASVGLVGNVLELGLPGVSVPFAVAFALVGIGGVLLVIWYILIARQLFLLAQPASKEEAKQPAVSLSLREKVGLSLEHELDKRLGGLFVGLVRLTGGRIARLWKVEVLILTTVGRRSGKARTVLLQFFRDGANMVIVAANTGRASHPGWFYNLKATPTARVQVMGRTLQVHAEELSTAEAIAFWPRILHVAPAYARYQQATSRAIPLVRLVPIGQARERTMPGSEALPGREEPSFTE